MFQITTLSVQEAMGFKVDREAVATLVLPQLWAMSMGPCMFTLLLIVPCFLFDSQCSMWNNFSASCR